MMAGIATPTEASATGALGTVLLALAYRRLTTAVLIDRPCARCASRR